MYSATSSTLIAVAASSSLPLSIHGRECNQNCMQMMEWSGRTCKMLSSTRRARTCRLLKQSNFVFQTHTSSRSLSIQALSLHRSRTHRPPVTHTFPLSQTWPAINIWPLQTRFVCACKCIAAKVNLKLNRRNPFSSEKQTTHWWRSISSKPSKVF